MFEFYTAGRILVGAGSLARVGAAAGELAARPLIVSPGEPFASDGTLKRLEGYLSAAGMGFARFDGAREEPTARQVDACLEALLAEAG